MLFLHINIYIHIYILVISVHIVSCMYIMYILLLILNYLIFFHLGNFLRIIIFKSLKQMYHIFYIILLTLFINLMMQNNPICWILFLRVFCAWAVSLQTFTSIICSHNWQSNLIKKLSHGICQFFYVIWLLNQKNETILIHFQKKVTCVILNMFQKTFLYSARGS